MSGYGIKTQAEPGVDTLSISATAIGANFVFDPLFLPFVCLDFLTEL